MKKHIIARILVSGSAATSVLFSGMAAAIDWNFTGFVRQEIAYSISSSDNPNNSWGNPFNGRITPLITTPGTGPAGARTTLGFGTNANAATGVLNPWIQANIAGAKSIVAGSNADAATTLHQSAPGVNEFGGLGGYFNRGFANPTNPALAAGPVAGTMIGLAAGQNTNGAVDCHFAYRRSLAANAAGFGYSPFHYANPTASGRLRGTFANAGNPHICGPVGAGIGDLGDLGNVLPGDRFDDPDGAHDGNNFNTFNSRAEFDVQARFNKEFAAYMKVRVFYDAVGAFSDSKVRDQFKGDMWGSRSQITEYNMSDAIIDIPALYLDWNRGPLWVRLGNQVIAWGEAYFFRTMDVANGLDLRRHLTLGPGAEEYQDQRVASPGVRVSYTFNNGWEVDAFAQLWSPTILPNQDTPYNLVPIHSAIMDDDDGLSDAQGAWNYGLRLTMPLTDNLTAIVGWINRRNPDGVFTGSDKHQDQFGVIQTACANDYDDALNFFAAPDLGEQFGLGVGGIPGFNFNFQVDGVTPEGGGGFHQASSVGQDGVTIIPGGGMSIRDGLAAARAEFARRGTPVPTQALSGSRAMANGCGNPFWGADRGPHAIQAWQGVQSGRIDGLNATRSLVNEFPYVKWQVRDVFGFGDEYTFADLYRLIDGFRGSYGPIGANVQRFFKRENIFMVGANYIVNADPDSFWDQLIIRGEVAVTPNKRITNDLSFNLKKVDDVVSALILEKYHRFTDAFPATYMVAQWMHRTSTDLFGRDLDKFDSPDFSDFIDPVTGNFTPLAFVPGATDPRGIDNANYVVFAFQQPFPNLVWRFDMSILVDVAGGYLVQPGLRYRPSANWQWDLYATIIESPGADNDTITESLDWADEVFVRLTYFF